MAKHVYINAFSIACAAGANRDAVEASVFNGAPPPRASDKAALIDGREVVVARLPASAVLDPSITTRTNAILARLLDDLRAQIPEIVENIPAERQAMIVGTSTTGISEGARDLAEKRRTGSWPAGFEFRRQLLGDTAQFAAHRWGSKGPAYTVSTACTSGARAMASAARLIRAGLADAVVCGGVDSFAEFTLNGFAALDSISTSGCNPFSANRDGITIGEGGAMFCLSAVPGPWRLKGVGESSDAHHISAPDPSGGGAELAVRGALSSAQITPEMINHVHMHGTATRLNDLMESHLINRVFGADKSASSTKGITGHTLGAAGAVQAALSLIAMDCGRYPPHVWDGALDPELASVNLAVAGKEVTEPLEHMMSVSFAFGGNNAALVLGRS